MRRPRLTSVAVLLLVSLLGVSSALAAPAADATSPPPLSLLRVQLALPLDLRTLQSLDVDLTENITSTSADVVARPGDVQRLADHGLAFEVLDPDLRASYRALTGGAAYPAYFHTYASMLSDMQAVHAAHPTLTSDVVSIGQSLEGRDIWAIQVSTTPVVTVPGKPEVLLVGNHHAREPISVEIPLDLLHQLTDLYGIDPQITDIVNTKQIWIIPMLNPDGHVYCETVDSYWRKNRRHNADGSYGVDLNRNYSYKWGYDEIGSSGSGSSDTYRGTAAFSEPETQHFRDFQAQHAFTRVISYHSYAQAILYPWGYADIYSPDQLTFSVAADSAARGITYSTGTDWEVLYNVNGEYCDWLYGETAQKPRAFGVTIEVGTSFYPTQQQTRTQVTENRAPAYYWMRSAGVNDSTSATLTLSAHSISVPRGGTLSFSSTTTNNTASAQTWRQWSEIVRPGGSPLAANPPGGYTTLTLAPGQSKVVNYSKTIPTTTPLGTYAWTYKVAATVPWPVLDSDALYFTVTATTTADAKGGTGMSIESAPATAESAPLGTIVVSGVRSARVRYAVADASSARGDVDVIDAAGRVVGAASVTPAGPGSAIASWDGRTRTGRTAEAGVYFLRTPGAMTRVVVLR